MNYHAYSYDIAHTEHDARVRSGELRSPMRAGLHGRRQRRKHSSPDSSSATISS
jgi:hypothetical protein